VKCNTTSLRICKSGCLVGVGKTSHTTHDAEHVIVGSIHANLGGLGSLNGGVGENKLKGGVVNAGEVAGAGRLVLLGAKGEGIHVDSGVGVTGVGLVRLHLVKVGSLTLREAVLAVKLELGGDDGVLSPAMHIQGGLGKHKGSGIRDTRVVNLGESKSGLGVGVGASMPVARVLNISGTGRLKEAVGVDESVLSSVSGVIVASDSLRSSKGMDGVGKSIHSVGVVERLGAKHLVKEGVTDKGRAVIHVGIGLHDPHKLLHGVVEVELDLVGRRTNRLVSSELELSDEVLVGVLGHTTTLISVKEHVIHIQGGSNQGLVVSDGSRHRLAGTGIAGAVEGGHSPQALVNGADVKVDLDLVVLKSDEGKGKSRVGTEPELEGHIESGLGKSVAGSTHLAGSLGVARSINVSEGGISDEGKLGGVSNHLEVTSLLLTCHGKLVPDVHPVTVLTVNALATNLHLHLSDDLLSGEVQPTGIDTAGIVAVSIGSRAHKLVDLGKSHLKVGAVSEISIAANGTLDTATEISLSIEGLLNGFNSKVSVASVGNLPESDLGVTSKVNILCAVSDQLHKSASHSYTMAKEKNICKIN